MHVKFIMDSIGEGRKFGMTTNPTHFYGNINKVVGLMQLFKEDLRISPPHTNFNKVLAMYNFIGLVSFNNYNKEVMMFLYDAENDEGKANELFHSLTEHNAPAELEENFKIVFHQIRNEYEELEGVAELVLPNDPAINN